MMAYLIKSGLMLSLFYLFFILVMKKTTFFRFNRLMLMTGSVLCLLLPLFDFSFVPASAVRYMPHFEIPDQTALAGGAGESAGWNLTAVLSAVYFSGVALVVAASVMSIFRTFAICRRGTLVRRDGINVTLSEKSVPSFSFFNHIVMSREDYEHNPVILQHETMHVKCLHSVDVVLFTVIAAFHWFNPLVWMARNVLKEVQEYEADEAVLKQGVDAAQYQLLLVRKAVGAERFRMANCFNHTRLKNRIRMMQSERTSKAAKAAYLVCLPLLLSVLCFCAKEENCSFRELDEMALFNGGNPGEFSKWMYQSLAFPESQKAEDGKRRVIASITIDRKGRVVNPKIVRGLSGEVDREVLRVLSSSPEWTPAKMNGKAVECTYTFPIILQ